jgi:cysteine-rich repeat protein
VRCDEICGDGLLFELPCDDGNLRDGDGCSSACTIETDYVCMNGSTTAPSICSYNGSMSVTLQTGDKSPTSNSLTLTYSIQPSAPLLSLNGGSIDFASMVSFPNSPSVTVTSAVLDPVTNELVIKLGYSVSLQDEGLTLQLTPPNVPQAVLVPKVSSTWIVAPTNQLAAVVYS